MFGSVNGQRIAERRARDRILPNEVIDRLSVSELTAILEIFLELVLMQLLGKRLRESGFFAAFASVDKAAPA